MLGEVLPASSTPERPAQNAATAPRSKESGFLVGGVIPSQNAWSSEFFFLDGGIISSQND